MSLVNVVIGDTFILRDNGDVAITGLTAVSFVTLEAYALPSGSPTATVTLTEIGAGEYSVAFTPTTAATWTVHVLYNAGGVFREFSQTYEVTSVVSSVTAVSATAAVSHTRKDLRRMLADDFGDLVILTATSPSTNTLTLIDSENINGGVEHYNGRQVLFTGGTAGNLGLVRRVTSTNDAANTLIFTPAVNSAVQSGDEAECVNERGKGFTIAEYHRAINRAIADAWPLGMIHAREEIVGLFDADTPEVTVPATLAKVYQVEWEDSNSVWHPILKATRTNHTGWMSDPAAGQLRIHGWPAAHADSATIRLLGYGRQGTLASDADTCALNADWLIAQAKYHLAFGARDKDDTLTSLGLAWRDEAMALRPRLRTIPRPGTESVRSI